MSPFISVRSSVQPDQSFVRGGSGGPSGRGGGTIFATGRANQVTTIGCPVFRTRSGSTGLDARNSVIRISVRGEREPRGERRRQVDRTGTVAPPFP